MRLAQQQRPPAPPPPEWQRYLTPDEKWRLREVEKDHLSYRRQRLNVLSQRDVFLADYSDGSKRAEFEALRRADTEWYRLYQRGSKRAKRDVAKLPHAVMAASENVRRGATEDVATAATEGLPIAPSPDPVQGERDPSAGEKSLDSGNRAPPLGRGEGAGEERQGEVDTLPGGDTMFLVLGKKKSVQREAKSDGSGDLSQSVAIILGQLRLASIGMFSDATSLRALSPSSQYLQRRRTAPCPPCITFANGEESSTNSSTTNANEEGHR
jgi:hypothetical protein